MQRALSRIFHQTCARSVRDSAVTLFVDFAHAVLFGLRWHPAGLVRTARLTLTCVPEALRAPLGRRVGLARAELRLHVSSTASSTASAFGPTASTAFRRVLLRLRTFVRVVSHLAAVVTLDVLVRRWSASLLAIALPALIASVIALAEASWLQKASLLFEKALRMFCAFIPFTRALARFACAKVVARLNLLLLLFVLQRDGLAE